LPQQPSCWGYTFSLVRPNGTYQPTNRIGWGIIKDPSGEIILRVHVYTEDELLALEEDLFNFDLVLASIDLNYGVKFT
jgi:hypothetical protein